MGCLKGGMMKVRIWWIIVAVALLVIVLLVAAFWGAGVSLILLTVVAIAVGIGYGEQERPELWEYKVREDAGELWSEAFPDKLEMTDKFREIIHDAFLMPESARGKVAPDDRIFGLYHLCVGWSIADSCELEFLEQGIEDEFGIEVDYSRDWSERTFGDLFKHILSKKRDLKESLEWCGIEMESVPARGTKKPAPEEFGLTSQEYRHLADERARFRKVVDRLPIFGTRLEKFILLPILSVVLTLFLGFLGWLAGLFLGFVFALLFGLKLLCSIFMIAGAVVGASCGLIFPLTKPYRNKKKRQRYREELLDPKYQKAALYEEAIVRYEYGQ
ncbi:MAG: hypothetical protein ACYTE5_07445 [Planctomycetota bacterium]